MQAPAPTPTPAVQVAAPSDTETPALASNPQPRISSPKPKEIGSPRIAASKDAKEAPRQTVAIVDNTPPQAVQPSSPVPVPVTEGSVSTPDTPETPVKPRQRPSQRLRQRLQNRLRPRCQQPRKTLPSRFTCFRPRPFRFTSSRHRQISHTDGARIKNRQLVSRSRRFRCRSRFRKCVKIRRRVTPRVTRETASPDRAPDPTPDKSSPRVTKSPDLQQPAPTRGITTQWTDVTASRPSDFNSSSSLSPEPVEPGHVSAALAAQETHVVLPELPKAPTSTDILLRLTGNDHSPAAIRVAERAGSVNVSVHTSDPVLRESLRSNLGELSSQLSGQGWKADVVKPATVAAQSESQQDSHASREGSSQQQQSFGGDRQPQRDRRTPGQWQQEFEQQTAGGDARPGGNR